jgi:hypothetical protein
MHAKLSKPGSERQRSYVLSLMWEIDSKHTNINMIIDR